MNIFVICETHNATAIVGPGSLIEELECGTCIDAPPSTPTDPEELFISRITDHDNGNCCCGSCEPAWCDDCGHYQAFCTCPRPIVPVSLVRRFPKYIPF